MTLAEKVAQLGSIWQGASGDGRRRGPDAGPVQRGAAAARRAHQERARPAHPGVRQPAGAGRRRDAGAGRAAGADHGQQPVRHPGGRARGVPDRVRRLGRDDLPDLAGLGRVLRPGPRRRDGGRVRRDHAGGRRAPGARAGPRRDPRLPVGPGRGDHRRGPVPGRHGRHRLRAGAAVGRPAGDAQALRRVLRVAGRPEPRAGLDGPARVRRRHPAPVRDGDQDRRRPVGDADLHRPRRRARKRRPEPAHRPAPRRARLRRRGRIRLLRGLLHPAPAPGRGGQGRRGRAGARGRA